MEQPARFGLADRLPCTNVPVFIHANVPHVAFPKLPPLHPLLLTEIFTADCKLFVSKTGLITEKCFYIMLLCVLDIFVELYSVLLANNIPCRKVLTHWRTERAGCASWDGAKCSFCQFEVPGNSDN